MFYREISYLKKVEDEGNPKNKRLKLNKREIRTLRMHYDNLPLDYFDYLKVIGAGGFKEGQFEVYDRLFLLIERGIYPDIELGNNIKFFGDDNDNEFSGFDLNSEDCLVIEYSVCDGKIYQTGKTFKEYLSEKILK